MTEDEMLQKVWRTLSETENSGYFVWDIMECMGEPFDESWFIKCRDDSFITIQCYHFWTLERADKSFTDTRYSNFQQIILI